MQAKFFWMMVLGWVFTWCWGFGQEGFEWVVKPGEYSYTGSVLEEWVAAQKNGKSGILNRVTGDFIECSSFSYIQSIENGSFIVRQDEKWGLIDNAGMVIAPCQFDFIHGFSEGLAVVQQNGKSGFIDGKSGKIVIPCQFDIAREFREGLANVRQNGKWGFIDKSGKMVVPCQFDDVEYFKDGLAVVKQNEGWGFIDKSGKIVIPCQFDRTWQFSEGLALIQQNGKIGIIDKSGKIVTPCQLDEKHSFSEGLAVVVQNGKMGFIDKSGKIVIPCQFDHAGSFSEGLAVVQQNEKWGFIDKHGKIVISYQFDRAWPFSEGLATVEQNGARGIIDKSGKIVIPCQFNDIQYFKNGLAVVTQNGSSGIINKAGKIIIPCQFADINSFEQWYTCKGQNGRWGIIDISGKIVIPCQFESMFPSYLSSMAFGGTVSTIPVAVDEDILFGGVKNFNKIGFIKICRQPTITWQNPAYSTIATPTNQINLKACIESNCSITDLSLYIDGKAQTISSARDFLVKKGNCDGYLFEQLVNLPNTERPIKVTLSVATNAGTFSSERVISIGQNTAPVALSEKRIALVIGNNAYANAPLRNPVNDALAMKIQLQQLGFNVHQYLDQPFKDMAKAINDFGLKAKDYDLALVYYAGHGIQYGESNYLVPVDAALNYPELVQSECIGLDRILQNLAGAQVKVGVVILDACRTNPFRRNWALASRNTINDGLTKSQPPMGTLIAYAADANQTADDNSDEPNGLYTSELLKNLKRPGLTLEQIFRDTRSKVIERTKNTKLQVPAEYSMLVGGDVILNRN
jgi:hypothetical protein